MSAGVLLADENVDNEVIEPGEETSVMDSESPVVYPDEDEDELPLAEPTFDDGIL